MVQDIRDSAGGWPVRQTQVEIDRILIKAKLRRRRMEPEATDGQSDYAKYQRYTTTIEKEKYRAGQKRHHEEAEQLDEGSPKRKAPCIREPLTELPVPKEESRPISKFFIIPSLAGVADNDYRSIDTQFSFRAFCDATRIKDWRERGMG